MIDTDLVSGGYCVLTYDRETVAAIRNIAMPPAQILNLCLIDWNVTREGKRLPITRRSIEQHVRLELIVLMLGAILDNEDHPQIPPKVTST